DPTWAKLGTNALRAKLSKRLRWEANDTTRHWISSYARFLEAGGKLAFKTLNRRLLLKKLERRPLLAGVCCTYLYGGKRYDTRRRRHSDVEGDMQGHFVVLSGYDPRTDRFDVVDPWHRNPFAKSGRYTAPVDRFLNAMFVAQVTHDCS